MSLAKFGNLFDIFGYTMLFNFVACLDFFNCLDSSVTDEFYIDETRVWCSKLKPGTLMVFLHYHENNKYNKDNAFVVSSFKTITLMSYYKGF